MTAISSATSDIELLNQHRNGSESAFADLVRRHLDWVYGVARRRVRDAHLADDVAQAVFILLHRKAPQFAADGAMIRWLYRTAWYASESAARSERRRIGREMNYASQHPEAVPSDQTPEWKELAPILDALVGKLSRADREAILLRYYRDLPLIDVAQQIGSTPEAARKRIERAVEKLRGLAAQQGVALSSASMALGLAQFVRTAPPPGLVATSTVAATVPAGSAISTSSASIVKGTLTMLAKTKIAIGSVTAAGLILALGAIYGSVWIFADGQVADSGSPTTLPTPVSPVPPAILFAANAPVPKLAPFSGIRWHGNVPEVEVNKTWYELRAVDGLTIEQVRNSQKYNNDPMWKKHVGEDLVEVMRQMHHPVGPAVDLDVRTLDPARSTMKLQQIPLTAENRDALMVWPAETQQTLFAELRWTNGMPEVRINDTWYELLSVEKETTGSLITSAKSAYADAWQDHFQENLLKVVRTKNKRELPATDVLVKTLDSGEDVTITVRVPQIARAVQGSMLVPAASPNAQYAGDNSFLKAAPFTAIRWRGDVPEVKVNGTWYELLSINSLTVAQIHASQVSHGDGNWKKHFAEDLVEVLTAMNHKPDATVDLQVRSLDGADTKTTLSGIAMTEANRTALMTSSPNAR